MSSNICGLASCLLLSPVIEPCYGANVYECARPYRVAVAVAVVGVGVGLAIAGARACTEWPHPHPHPMGAPAPALEELRARVAVAVAAALERRSAERRTVAANDMMGRGVDEAQRVVVSGSGGPQDATVLNRCLCQQNLRSGFYPRAWRLDSMVLGFRGIAGLGFPGIRAAAVNSTIVSKCDAFSKVQARNPTRDFWWSTALDAVRNVSGVRSEPPTLQRADALKRKLQP